jgi:hypothetical protein
MIVGSDKIMLMSIEQRIMVKLTVKACDLVSAIVAQKHAIARYAVET